MSPKRKNKKYCVINEDLTIKDYADAQKSNNRQKKPNNKISTDIPWDAINVDNLLLVEETSEDGSKSVILKNKNEKEKSKHALEVYERPGFEYPEFIWYLLSRYMRPEHVTTFALINKTTYAITKTESFWRTLYRKYCKNHWRLPDKLKIDETFRSYGLKQRVVRSLYLSYDLFVERARSTSQQDSKPHLLIKRLCTSLWFKKFKEQWIYFFKLKDVPIVSNFRKDPTSDKTNLVHLLSDIDANQDNDCKVLQITCQNFYHTPLVMGMTLSSVRITISHGFRHHRIHLGFTTGQHNVSKHTVPEVSIILDSVIHYSVIDWWHPIYPYYEESLQINTLYTDGDIEPLLKTEFLKVT